MTTVTRDTVTLSFHASVTVTVDAQDWMRLWGISREAVPADLASYCTELFGTEPGCVRSGEVRGTVTWRWAPEIPAG